MYGGLNALIAGLKDTIQWKKPRPSEQSCIILSIITFLMINWLKCLEILNLNIFNDHNRRDKDLRKEEYKSSKSKPKIRGRPKPISSRAMQYAKMREKQRAQRAWDRAAPERKRVLEIQQSS